MAPGRVARLEIDHVLITVDDLGEADRALRSSHGLTSIEGGQHPDWGTANRLVPLGDSYLELVTVVEESQAKRSAFGRWVGTARPGTRLLGWAARTSDLDRVAQRLNLVPTAGARRRRDGTMIRWRLAGVEQAAEAPFLPFFIEWSDGTRLPGRTDVKHAAGPMRLAELQLRGRSNQLDEWLGPHRLPISVTPGAPATTAVVLSGTTANEIILEASSL